MTVHELAPGGYGSKPPGGFGGQCAEVLLVTRDQRSLVVEGGRHQVLGGGPALPSENGPLPGVRAWRGSGWGVQE